MASNVIASRETTTITEYDVNSPTTEEKIF
jgi:hypothetical protein